jgi:small subunit ribosomal protein S10
MKLRLVLKSFDGKILNLVINKLKLKFIENNFKILSIVSMQTKSKKFCLLRSPHIDKDSREHFEIKNFKSFIDFEINSIKSLNNLLNIELINGISYCIKNLSF